MAYSEEIRKAIETFFKEDEWIVEFDEERGIFSGGIGGLEGKISSVKFYVIVRDESATVYEMLPIQADNAVRSKAAEFITRANYGLDYGCFEMDFNDGEIRYKTNVSKAELEQDRNAAIQHALQVPIAMIMRYADGLLKVLFGMMEPAEAIAEAEKPKK